ncbi:hypothetical protein ACFLZR_00105 [Candidatus Neomarinimicrobiota bacterium]
MSYHAILLFLHILFIALFVGSSGVLWLLWRQYRMTEPNLKRTVVEGMLLISQRITTVSGSFLFLSGLLILIWQPGILRGGGIWFAIKIILGFVAVGLAHVTHVVLRKEHLALQNSKTDEDREKKLTLNLALVGTLSVLALLLGYSILHG